jgi:gamma-glutamyltranspeptidase / glutathione hydrolase
MKPMSMDFQSRRSMVIGRGGMVAASNPLASQVGLQILREGGTAADAAVATAAMLNVTEPASTGIGGDCFALYYDAKTRQVTALNGSGRSPAALSLTDLRNRGWSEMPERHPLTVTVPGTVAGWHDLLQRYGEMSLRNVLQPAISYARDGFPVYPVFGEAWQRSTEFLRVVQHVGDYLPSGRAPQVGEIVRLPALARSLEIIAEGGPEAFYKGPIADAIIRTLEAVGGVMTHDDLQQHRSDWDEPITLNYRGYTVCQHPPNGQGLAALQALGIAEAWDLAALPWASPERFHLMIEAMRLAFADARYYVADPHTNPAPIESLLDPAYLAQRRQMIARDAAMQPPTYGMPIPSSNTVYLSVVDGAGNACSFINSLYYGWGSGIIAEGTGIFLQNRGACFSLEPGHPNAAAGAKRPYHTIIPGLVLREGELWASLGVMGGFMQPQGHFQMMSALVDDDLNPQEALNMPRFCLEAGTASSILCLEEGVPVATMSRLAEMGHTVKPVSGAGRGVFGDGQIILRDPHTGVLYGGSDPRKDGQVAAW